MTNSQSECIPSNPNPSKEGWLDREVLNEGIEDSCPDTDGLNLGSMEGWLYLEGIWLGSDEGLLDTDGFKDGVEDGCPLGSDEGLLDADGSNDGVEDGCPDTVGLKLGSG